MSGKDDASTNTDQYTDKLTLGTGLNSSIHFQLAGETTSFTGINLNIFWRLESKDDVAGSTVTFKIEELASGTYTTVQTLPYSNPYSYGHIMLSSFPWSQTGSFRATGMLTLPNKTVASREFTIQ